MLTLDDLLLDVDDLYAQMRIQLAFHAHQCGVSGAMDRALEIRRRALETPKPDIFDELAELEQEPKP